MSSLEDEDLVTREDFEAFIGPTSKKPFYQKALDNYLQNPNKPNWCLSCCIFNIFWFAYRKTLLPSILLAFIYFVLATAVPIQFLIPILLVIFIVIGLFGVNLYFILAEKDIKKIKQYHMMSSEEDTLTAISKKGGITFYYPLFVYLILLVFFLAFSSKLF